MRAGGAAPRSLVWRHLIEGSGFDGEGWLRVAEGGIAAVGRGQPDSMTASGPC